MRAYDFFYIDFLLKMFYVININHLIFHFPDARHSEACVDWFGMVDDGGFDLEGAGAGAAGIQVMPFYVGDVPF